MRIGLVAPVSCAVPPVGYGGTEQVVDALARGLVGLGHEVLLAATGDSTCPVPTRSLLATPVFDDHRAELRHVLFAHDQLAGCDVVHDHTLLGPLLGVGRTHGPPVVTTCHGVLAGELAAWYRQLSVHVPVVAISRSQAAGAPGLARAVVHHGVVPQDYPFGLGDGGHLLFLGRMSPDKGAHRAIAVARATGLPLLVAGRLREPQELDYFERHVRPQLGDGVDWVGEVAGDEKLALLAGARALLMPIRWPEPFGMVMVEAQACGTPVLAFREGAAPEVVEDGVTGWLCRDEDDMAGAALRVGELSRQACRSAVEQRFSAREMARRHVEVYRSLLDPGRPQQHPRRQAGHGDAPLRIDLDVDPRPTERDAPHGQ